MTAPRARRVESKWRPSLALVLGGVLAFALAAPPVGLVAARWLAAGPAGLGFPAAAALVSAVVVAATAVLGWLLWRLILRPVTALAERAVALGRGDAAAGVEPLRHYGTRELGALGREVLAMAAQLRAREATIRGFADHATHELRTPIAAIRGAAELLAEAPDLGEGDRRLVAAAGDAAARLSGLLDSLRGVALLRASSFSGTCRLRDAARAVEPRGLLAVEGGDTALPLSAEGLRVVLGQLAGNAARHGATRLRVRASPEGPTLLVEDDGEGIAPGDAPRVFDPFFTTRREAGGTGMGLHIARTLLEAHGARIELVPAERGAAFRIGWGEGAPEP